jgi:hypothetical protein
MTKTTLQQFDIQGAAEVGGCGSEGSFRALRRADGNEVLLHRFRPAATIINQRPVVNDPNDPGFDRPFVSRITSIFEVAGSAYLVEPLPVCVALSDVWRTVLIKAPQAAIGSVDALLQQLGQVCCQPLSGDPIGASVTIDHVVLTPDGIYGLLCPAIDSSEGLLGLRPGTPPPADEPPIDPLARVLVSLTAIADSMAAVNQSPILAPHHRQTLLEMAAALDTTGTS